MTHHHETPGRTHAVICEHALVREKVVVELTPRGVGWWWCAHHRVVHDDRDTAVYEWDARLPIPLRPFGVTLSVTTRDFG